MSYYREYPISLQEGKLFGETFFRIGILSCLGTSYLLVSFELGVLIFELVLVDGMEIGGGVWLGRRWGRI